MTATATTEFEMSLASELGVTPEQIFVNEATRKVWQRLVDLEFSKRQPAAVQTTEQAMQTADDHADPDWKDRFDEALEWVAQHKPALTSDDVLNRLEQLPNPPKTHNYSAIGPAMTRAMKNDLIEPTGRVLRSERPAKHGNRQNVWASKIFKPGGQKCMF